MPVLKGGLPLTLIDMISYTCTMCMLVFLCGPGAHGECIYPPPNPDPAFASLESTNQTFNTGDYVVWSCKHVDGRFGVIPVRCESEGWQRHSDVRKCKDAMPVENGAIAGMVFAVLTAIITIGGIVFARCTGEIKKDKPEE